MGSISVNVNFQNLHLMIVEGVARTVGAGTSITIHRADLQVDEILDLDNDADFRFLVRAARLGATEFEAEASGQWGSDWTSLPTVVRAQTRVVLAALPEPLDD
jgi:hypothetical protein